MRNQEELKKAMQEVLEKEVWTKSPKMVDYCIKKTAYIVELENGDFTDIEKPNIETSFCFGYGYCGVSTEEDYQNAASMSRHARTNEEYFLQENLKGLDGMIANFRDDDLRAYKRLHYIGQTEGSHLMNIEFCRYYQAPEKGWIEMTDAERQAMIAGYEIVRKQFEKRLNTYLKRYGTSKLHTWTYLVD